MRQVGECYKIRVDLTLTEASRSELLGLSCLLREQTEGLNKYVSTINELLSRAVKGLEKVDPTLVRELVEYFKIAKTEINSTMQTALRKLENKAVSGQLVLTAVNEEETCVLTWRDKRVPVMEEDTNEEKISELNNVGAELRDTLRRKLD